jgi:hypothetical protein
VKKELFFGVLISSVLFCWTSAKAGGTDLLIDKFVEKGALTASEGSILKSDVEQQQRKELAAGAVTTLPQWIQNIMMKGDLRLRVQDDYSTYTRTRERLRLRLGFETRMAESITAAFGLATGSEKILDKTISGAQEAETVKGDTIIDAEPTSTNHTFSNGFGKAMVMVDFAYLQYNPVSWLMVTGGKMKAKTNVWNPSDLLWDTDINPDGIAIGLNKKLAPGLEGFLNGSWLIFNDLNTAGANNPDAYIEQIGLKWNVNDNINVQAAVANQLLTVNGKNTGYYGTPAFDYNCINPSLDINIKDALMGYAVRLFGDTITNGDAKVSSDAAGYLYGLKFGDDKISSFGQWDVVYMLRRLEKNSWLNLLGDSDSYGGAVNSAGYEAIVDFGLTNAATLTLDYYKMDAILGATAASPKSLIQCDIVYKF